MLVTAVIAAFGTHYAGKMLEDDPKDRPSRIVAFLLGAVAGAALFAIQFFLPFLLPIAAVLALAVFGFAVLKTIAGVKSELVVNVNKKRETRRKRDDFDEVLGEVQAASNAHKKAKNTLIGDSSREKDLWQARYYDYHITNKYQKNIEKAEWRANKKARKQQIRTLTVEQFLPADYQEDKTLVEVSAA
jgi:hypothetical protein